MATLAHYLTRDEIELQNRVVELYRGNVSMKRIGEAVGLSVYIVRGILRAHRVPLRDSREQQTFEHARRRGEAREQPVPTPAMACCRYGIMRYAAPAGEGGLCGWCVEELRVVKGAHHG